MLKNKLFLIVLLFVFLSSHGSFNSIVVKASDEKLNNVESALLYRPNYDGRIVFSSNARGNNYNLYVADAGGGDLHEITHEPGDEINPSISPDGNFVAYAQNNEGDWNITIMEIDTEHRWNLTHCCHDEKQPDWSDWDRIAYQSNKYRNWDIMWKDAFGPEWDGGTSEDMEITNSPQNETNPAWGRYNFASMIAYDREGDIWAFDDNMRQEFRTPASGGGNQVLPLWYPGEDIFPNSRGPALIYKDQEKPGLMWTDLDGGNKGPLLKTQDQNLRNIPVISASFGMSPETIGFVTKKGEIMVFNFHSKENPAMIDVREHRGRIKDMDWGPWGSHGGPSGGFMGMGGGGNRAPGGGGGGGMMDRMRDIIPGGKGGGNQMDDRMMEEGRKMMQEQEEMQRRMMDEQRNMEEEQRERERQREEEDRRRQDEERNRRQQEDEQRNKMEQERRALELKSEQDRLSLEDERRMRELESRREEMEMERDMREEQMRMDEERREMERRDEEERMAQQARMMEEQRRMMREEAAARGGTGPGPDGGGPGGPDFYVRGASEEQYNCMVQTLGPPVVEQFNFRDPRPEEYERLNNNGCEGIPELFGQEVYGDDDRGFFGKPKMGALKTGGPGEMMQDPTMLAVAGLVVTVGATLLQMARGK